MFGVASWKTSRAGVGLTLITMLLGCGGPGIGDPVETTGHYRQAESKGSDGNPAVIPPNAHPRGLTYGAWSARWWQWSFSLPVDHHPLTDTADCSTAQTGGVWFLGGTIFPTTTPTGDNIGKAERSCSVPPGTMLFFPIINAEQSAIESCFFGGQGGCHPTDADLAADAKGFQDGAQDLSAQVDGVAIQDLNPAGGANSPYRVVSPPFEFGPLPDNNQLEAFGVPGTVGAMTRSVADGVYLMLAPLSAGPHTIVFHGEVPTFRFTLDITYHITVTPPGH